MLSKSPLMMPIDEGRLVEQKAVIDLGLIWIQLFERRIWADERIGISFLRHHRERRYWVVVDGPLTDALIVQGSDWNYIWPFSYFDHLPRVIRRRNSCCDSYSIISSWIEVSNDASVRLSLVDLSELLDASHFDSDAILQEILHGLYHEQLSAFFCQMFPLELNGCRWAFCLGKNSFLKSHLRLTHLEWISLCHGQLRLILKWGTK
jgi:hypothetical protein